LQHNIPVVEDAAHGVGSVYGGHKVGADALPPAGLKRVTAFSFYATKNMTTGEGGMLATADDDLAERMRLLSLHGMSRDAWKRYTSSGSWYYEVVAAGYKDNMTDIQSALGIHQLRKLDDFIATRQKYAQAYDQALAMIGEITTPATRPNRNHIYHLYVIQLDLRKLKIDRAQFIEELKGMNIGTSVHFIPVHLHPFYQKEFGYRKGDLPHCEYLYERIISLPLYPRMSTEDVQDVASVVKMLVAKYRP